jgi:hypothetical protein
MNTLPTRQHIDTVLDQFSPAQLSVVAGFVDFLKHRTDRSGEIGKTIPIAKSCLHGSTAKDLLELAGTWEGDDLRECLQLVSESRASLEF